MYPCTYGLSVDRNVWYNHARGEVHSYLSNKLFGKKNNRRIFSFELFSHVWCELCKYSFFLILLVFYPVIYFLFFLTRKSGTNYWDFYLFVISIASPCKQWNWNTELAENTIVSSILFSNSIRSLQHKLYGLWCFITYVSLS